jgi:hypothetical protein
MSETMSTIIKSEVPLIAVVGDIGMSLGKYVSSLNEEISMQLYNPENGVSEIGIIHAISRRNNTRKVFCYSKSFDLNIVTAFMGYPFNSRIWVNEKNNSAKINLNYDLRHLWEVHKKNEISYKKTADNIINNVDREFIEFHQEYTKMDTLEKIDLKKLNEMYNYLIDSAKIVV